MKSITTSTTTFYFFISILFLLSCVSCSKKLYFEVSAVTPAADGTVKYKKGENDNYSIKLKILHLADPQKLIPPKDYYVFWMQTEANGIKNLGQVKSSNSWPSSTLKASLTTVTAFRPKSFFITAENFVNTSYPGNQIVLRTQ